MLRRGLDYAAGTVLICAVCAALLLLAAEILSFSSPVADAAAALAATLLLNSLRRRLRPRARRRFGPGTPGASGDRPASSADTRRQEGCQLGQGQRGLQPRPHQGMVAGDRSLAGGVYATRCTSRVVDTTPARPARCRMKPEVLAGHVSEEPAKTGLFGATAGQPLAIGR
jgi:hypothetical protein